MGTALISSVRELFKKGYASPEVPWGVNQNTGITFARSLHHL